MSCARFLSLTACFICLQLSLLSPLAQAAENSFQGHLQARAAILVEASSGKVLFAQKATQRLPIASTTKLMTAWVTLEEVSLSDIFSASGYRAGPAETVLGLRAKERMKVSDLLRALLLVSANDAAVTLADGVAGSRTGFIRLMNRQAKALGLKGTHYSTPVGLDSSGNYSTAHDLAQLALRLRKNSFFRRTVNMPSAVLMSGSSRRRILNRNELVRKVAYIDGVKTGHTLQAGYVLVGSGTREGMSLVSVVLGDPSDLARQLDTLKLMSYGFKNYRLAQLISAGRHFKSVSIQYRDEKVGLVAARGVRSVIRRGAKITTRVTAPALLKGPLRKGERVGSVTVKVDGKKVDRIPLLLASSVPKPSLIERATAKIYIWVTLVGVLFLIGGGGVIVSRRRSSRLSSGERTRRVNVERQFDGRQL